jgi:hypothetical protein
VILFPLFLAALLRPFGLWDYFTAPNIYLPDKSFTLVAIVKNYLLNVFTATPTVRPTTSLLIDLGYTVFGGEFWLWYVGRWAAKILCAVFANYILKAYDVPPLARLASISLLLFHPAATELMLISADMWVGSFILCLLATLVRFNRGVSCFSIDTLTKSQFVAVFLLWFLALGTKEVGAVFASLFFLISFFESANRKAFALRAVPFIVVLLFWAWKLRTSSIIFPSTNLSASGGVRIHLSTLLGHISFLNAGFPSYLGLMLLMVLAAWAIWRLWKPVNNQLRLLTVYCALCAGISILFVSTTNLPAPRYITSCIVSLALLAGLALRDLAPRAGLVIGAFAAIYPIAAAANLYSQALAYQQLFSETSDVLNFAEQQSRRGYRLALTGDDDDIPLENQGTIRLFFERYANLFYGKASAERVWELRTRGMPRDKFALVTHRPSSQVGSSYGINEAMIESAFQIERSGYGFLEKLTNGFIAVDRPLGTAWQRTYDLGAPVVSGTSFFSVYLIDPNRGEAGPEPASGRVAVAEFSNLSRRTKKEDPMKPGRVYSYEAAPREVVKWLLPLPRLSGVAQFKFDGQILVQKGRVSVGVTDPSGNDLWNTVFEQTSTWRALPEVPAVTFRSEQQYYFFVFGSEQSGIEFLLRDIQLRQGSSIIRLPSPRRYGAVGW